MKHLRGMPRSCTLCQNRFHLVGPAMANPADILCNDCVAQWWRDDRAGADLRAALEPVVRTDLGVDVGNIASGIARRVEQLRDFARSESELQQVLAERTPSRI